MAFHEDVVLMYFRLPTLGSALCEAVALNYFCRHGCAGSSCKWSGRRQNWFRAEKLTTGLPGDLQGFAGKSPGLGFVSL